MALPVHYTIRTTGPPPQIKLPLGITNCSFDCALDLAIGHCQRSRLDEGIICGLRTPSLPSR